MAGDHPGHSLVVLLRHLSRPRSAPPQQVPQAPGRDSQEQRGSHICLAPSPAKPATEPQGRGGPGPTSADQHATRVQTTSPARCTRGCPGSRVKELDAFWEETGA